MVYQVGISKLYYDKRPTKSRKRNYSLT